MFGQFCPVWWASFNTYFYMLNNFVQFFIHIYQKYPNNIIQVPRPNGPWSPKFSTFNSGYLLILDPAGFFFFQINSVFNGWIFFFFGKSEVKYTVFPCWINAALYLPLDYKKNTLKIVWRTENTSFLFSNRSCKYKVIIKCYTERKKIYYKFKLGLIII